jgi:hypothetical protein
MSTATLEAPKTLAQERDELLRLANEADRQEGSEVKTETSVEKATEGKATHDGEQGKEGTKLAGDPKAGAPENKDEAKVEVGKSAPTADDKKAKEEDRKVKSWKALNEEKVQLKAEREAMEADRKELAELRARHAKQKADTEAERYERIAEDFDAEGKEDAARLARNEAAKARTKVAQEMHASQAEQFKKGWQANYDKLAETYPELHDEESILYKDVANLINKEPLLRSTPDGINKAVTFVRALHDAASAADLRKQLEANSKTIEELNQKLSLGGSLPGGPGKGAKKFEDMDLKEQREHLLQQAKEAEANE